MRKLLFFIPIFILIFGCKQPTKFHATSYIRFLSEEKTTDVQFKITEEKAPTTFRKVDELFFNDGAMERSQNNVQGIFYRSEKDGDFPATFSFRFKDNKNQYNTSYKTTPITSLVVKDSIANKLAGMTISWQGEPLSKDELLTIIITDADDLTAEAKIKGATAKASVNIPGAMFSGLKSGKGSVYAIKTSISTIESENLSLDATTDYFSQTVSINIKE